MKINNISNSNISLSFQKILKAHAAVLKEGKTTPVDIYQLDGSEIDKNIFFRAMCSPFWDDNHYLLDVLSHYTTFGKDSSCEFYSIENEDGDMLCICEAFNQDTNKELAYLETAPQHSTLNKDRKYRYIGETMLAFLSYLCKKDGKDLWVSSVADRPQTRNFYYSLCHMSQPDSDEAILKRRNLKRLIKGNEEHVKSKIDIID